MNFVRILISYEFEICSIVTRSKVRSQLVKWHSNFSILYVLQLSAIFFLTFYDVYRRSANLSFVWTSMLFAFSKITSTFCRQNCICRNMPKACSAVTTWNHFVQKTSGTWWNQNSQKLSKDRAQRAVFHFIATFVSGICQNDESSMWMYLHEGWKGSWSVVKWNGAVLKLKKVERDRRTVWKWSQNVVRPLENICIENHAQGVRRGWPMVPMIEKISKLKWSNQTEEFQVNRSFEFQVRQWKNQVTSKCNELGNERETVQGKNMIKSSAK